LPGLAEFLKRPQAVQIGAKSIMQQAVYAMQSAMVVLGVALLTIRRPSYHMQAPGRIAATLRQEALVIDLLAAPFRFARFAIS
jgi:hypothetical protein